MLDLLAVAAHGAAEEHAEATAFGIAPGGYVALAMLVVFGIMLYAKEERFSVTRLLICLLTIASVIPMLATPVVFQASGFDRASIQTEVAAFATQLGTQMKASVRYGWEKVTGRR